MRPVHLALLMAGLLLPAAGCTNFPRKDVEPLYRDPDRQLHVTVKSWKALKEENVVMQKRDYTCGAAALATLVRYYWGDNVTENDFLQAILATLTPAEVQERMKNGLSMTDLRRAAVKKGYLASIGRLRMENLVELKAPIIVRIVVNGHEHFVVLRGLVEDRVFLADPIRGNVRLSVEEFSRQWTDRAMLAVAKPGVNPPADAPLLDLPAVGWVRPELEAGRRSLFLTR